MNITREADQFPSMAEEPSIVELMTDGKRAKVVSNTNFHTGIFATPAKYVSISLGVAGIRNTTNTTVSILDESLRKV